MAQGPVWVPHLLAFHEQGLQRDDPSETTPIYTPDQKAYKCYWHKRTPLYAQTGIHVHLVHHLSIPGRLGVYEVVGDGWQLNVINAHVPFGDAGEPFLQTLPEAYRQMAMLALPVPHPQPLPPPLPLTQASPTPPHPQVHVLPPPLQDLELRPLSPPGPPPTSPGGLPPLSRSPAAG